MPPLLHRRVVLGVAGVLLGTGLSACTTTPAGGPMDGGSGQRMMGGNSGYRYSSRTCTPPAQLPGTRVPVMVGDRGMAHMAGGVAPMGAHMMLRASTDRVPAGEVSLVVVNRGWRTHELVVLPLAPGTAAGRRPVGAAGRVSERGSLGEASRSCGADAGEGIRSGSVGWTTIRLPAGRYELLCNLRHHYADGMYQALVVS